MPLPKSNNYTIEDIYSLPDGQRAELIDGQIYNMAPLSPFHQELVMELSATLRDYIKKNSGQYASRHMLKKEMANEMCENLRR